jgi:hypothetical protein
MAREILKQGSEEGSLLCAGNDHDIVMETYGLAIRVAHTLMRNAAGAVLSAAELHEGGCRFHRQATELGEQLGSVLDSTEARTVEQQADVDRLQALTDDAMRSWQERNSYLQTATVYCAAAANASQVAFQHMQIAYNATDSGSDDPDDPDGEEWDDLDAPVSGQGDVN